VIATPGYDPSAELSGHTFELLGLERRGEFWLAQFAVDGRKYEPFYDPYVNSLEMDESAFMSHLKSQSLGMVEYTCEKEAR
jgi:hypothetical protein